MSTAIANSSRNANAPGFLARMLNRVSGTTVAQIVVVIVFFSAWEILSGVFKAEFWVSKPSLVVEALISWYRSGELVSDLKITLLEAGVGFVAGSIVGGLVGFILGWVRKLGDLFERCCHVKFLWPERPGARRYSGETGRNFPCIESFEAMVANCVCGSATRWNRETIAGR